MRQNKMLFFVIIGFAIIAVIGMLSFNLFMGETVRKQQQVTIELVVAPSIKEWVESASTKFNKNNKDITVKIVTAETLIPETQLLNSSTQPVAWLAEATFIVDLASTSNSQLQFDDVKSTASTSLAWGRFKNEDSKQVGKLNWNTIHQQAVQANSNFKLVIASPHNSAEGLAALISATAAHLNKKTLSETDVNSAKIWLTETFKEIRLSHKPAEDYATKGVSTGDAGISTLSSWHSVGLQSKPDFSINPTQINMTLDYPFAIRTGAKSSLEGQAAAAFRDFLLEDTQQNALPALFFGPPLTNSDNTVQIDGQAVLSLLRWAELELR